MKHIMIAPAALDALEAELKFGLQCAQRMDKSVKVTLAYRIEPTLPLTLRWSMASSRKDAAPSEGGRVIDGQLVLPGMETARLEYAPDPEEGAD